ncbi:MAG TPA: hypothetical protein VFH95_08540 [Candidatus Kapabacteria bacterium]|nr:hypothetical protein [Candidatus Kapabacteria bacterium]
MRNVELAETDDTFVILVDKHQVDRFTVERAVTVLERDFSHIPAASDEEQADIVRSLEAMTDEERKPSDLVIRRSISL